MLILININNININFKKLISQGGSGRENRTFCNIKALHKDIFGLFRYILGSI